MKQHCRFYQHNNLKECWETNDKGKVTYRIKYTYHRIGKKHKLKRTEDSNGWIITYYKNGNIKKEVGCPDEELCYQGLSYYRMTPRPYRPLIDWEFHYMW